MRSERFWPEWSPILVWRVSTAAALAAFVYLGAAGTVASVIDLRTRRVPDKAVKAGDAIITLDDNQSGDEPWLECEPAARLLVIWGRRPDRRDQLSSHMPSDMLARLQALLAGY